MKKYQEIYNKEPADIEVFWKNYPYFNPEILYKENNNYRYQFISLAEANTDDAALAEMLNQYLNVKFNPVTNYKSLEENLKKFSGLAAESSIIINNILKRADFPEDVERLFGESQIVADTNDIREMIILYNRQNDERTRYEILRKIGLTILLNRVKNTQIFQKSLRDNYFINRLFLEQLNLKQQRHIVESNVAIYFWLDDKDNLVFSYDEKNAVSSHKKDSSERLKNGKTVYDLQKEIIFPQNTKGQNWVLKYISRIKNKHYDKDDYTSIIEKIIRKNILFPVEITDIHGVTFVVDSEQDMYDLISEIEDFLGGTNTRKNDKIIEKAWNQNIVHNRGEYFKIWKTVYDITLPHEMLDLTNYAIEKLKNDIAVLEKIKLSLNNSSDQLDLIPMIEDQLAEKQKESKKLGRLKKFYEKKPFDIYLEIQIQELKSYLLSRCPGSEIEHKLHKHRQVMSSSFYKLFPRKIYEPVLAKLK